MLVLWASFRKSGYTTVLCVTYNYRFTQNYPDEGRGIWREERAERNVATKKKKVRLCEFGEIVFFRDPTTFILAIINSMTWYKILTSVG